ncbi:hypothetical protein F511_08231 [Dorcoceras hygrometricum]|uniref:Uncharacterized protein n=1 Tax=Dorcoceras hygrometricum TaxID=472368 RepID=A0A2Z7BZ63_9LAMI|nr:hypothetical protein F511_08231 [Dorcoceras hygrometricum]
MTSSYSADGLRDQTQESADSAGRVCVVNQSQDSVATQRFPDAVLGYPVARNPGAKNCRSSKAQQLKKESAAKQLTTYKSVTQLRLFVHLRSLGVLTAAGCGIGSVHAVVRSNLLVEPFEVEEGEM